MPSLTRLSALVIVLLALGGALRASAQEYVVAVAEENFRARPNGTKLGTLRRGATLAALEERGRWVQASLTGWIWGRSVEPARGSGRLRVSVPSENLRASPSARGRLLGTVLRGTQMRRLGSRGGWMRVRYDGWVWQPSLAGAGADAAEETTAETAGAWTPDRTVSAEEENLRAEPNGKRLGRLQRGADLTVVARRGSWLQVAARGSFWTGSTRGTGDSRRVAVDVENFRVAPGAAVQGVLARDTPLRVLGRAGKWLDVEVRGWMWEPSTRALASAPAAGEGHAAGEEGPAARDAAPEEDATTRDAGASATGDVGAASASTTAPAPVLAATAPPRRLSRSIPLKAAPDGELVAQALAGSQVVPLRSQGDWVKVRLEGWVPRALVEDAGPPAKRTGGEVTVGMVAADPDVHRGAAATWRLELISVEQADRARSDFRPGEHYLLTRNLEGEREYVYVAIPASAAATFRELPSFEPLRIRGVVRTGRSALVGNPILEYRELLEPAR